MLSGHQQHLSDEAIAAFADDVLTRHARERARRHTAVCPECNHAVAVQREAVWALRAAPAPSLPTGLLDRLRDVPATTPIRHLPTHVDEHGTTMFATFAAPAAALVASPSPSPSSSSRRARTVTMAVASAAVLGVLATTAASDRAPAPRAHPAGGSHITLTGVDLPMHPR
jgi:anti-sigma factor RsiW